MNVYFVYKVLTNRIRALIRAAGYLVPIGHSVKLNLVKTGLKFKFGVNPYFFSHELCLYITRFLLA